MLEQTASVHQMKDGLQSYNWRPIDNNPRFDIPGTASPSVCGSSLTVQDNDSWISSHGLVFPSSTTECVWEIVNHLLPLKKKKKSNM